MRPLSFNCKLQIADCKFPALLFAVLLFALPAPSALGADPAEELWAAQGSVAAPSDLAPPPPGFVEEREEPLPPSEEIASKAAGRPYVVFATNPIEPVGPYYCPSGWEVTDAVGSFASPGEYEPLTFAVYTLSGVRGLRTEVRPMVLRGEPGAQIPVSSMDLRAGRCLNRYVGEKRFRREPFILERFTQSDVPAGDVKQLWLTVHVPADAPPGLYEGEILLRNDPGGEQAIKTRLRVLPIRLLQPPTVYGFWHAPGGSWTASHDASARLDTLRRWFVQMRESGLNSLGVLSSPAVAGKADAVTCDFTREGSGGKTGYYGLADIMRLGRATGLLCERFPILYSGVEPLRTVIAADLGLNTDDPKFDAAYAEAARAIAQEGQSQKWPPFVFVPVDELDNRDPLRREAIRWLGVLRKAGLTTGATLNGVAYGQDSADADDLRNLIDVRIFNFVDERTLDAAQRAQRPVWLYNAGASPWEPKRTRLVFGFYTARCRADGCFQWAYPWPDRAAVGTAPSAGGDAVFGVRGFCYTAADGPLPNIAMEAIREGIDDMRYLCTLTQAVLDARKAGRTVEADAVVGEIKAILSAIPLDSAQVRTYCDGISADSMHAARWRLALALMRISQKE